MADQLPRKPEAVITDLNDFNERENSLFMTTNAKNMDRLRDLNIEHLWLIGANDKELRKILPLVNVKYLNVYQLLAKDLSILETLEQTETIILNWNTKSTSLWDISKNKGLKTLEITDFSKLENIDQLSLATQINDLTLRGGHGKPLKIKSVSPLKGLLNLRTLCLTNLKIADDTLQPLAHLRKLTSLYLSNQFETYEYAWLATRLPNTKCIMFQAINSCNIVGVNNELVSDTMVTGRRKPFLLSGKDQSKIDKYIRDFEKLKNELAESNNNL